MDKDINNFETPTVVIPESTPPREKDTLDGYLEKYRNYDIETVDKLNLHHIKDLQEKFDKGDVDQDLSRNDIAAAFKELEDATEIPSDENNRKQVGIMSRVVWAGMRDAVLNTNELIPELPLLKNVGIGGGGIAGKTKEQVGEKLQGKVKEGEEPKGILESLGKSIVQFNTAFVPTYKLVSKGIKNPLYAGAVSGAISSFLAFKGADGNIVDISKEYPELYKKLPDFLKGKEGESEFEARIRNTVVGEAVGAIQAPVVKSILGRFKVFKDWYQTEEAVIHFQKKRDARSDFYDKALKSDEFINKPPIDRQPKMTFDDMNELARESSLGFEQLLQTKTPDHTIAKTKNEMIGEGVRAIQIRDEAFNQFSSAIPEYKALLKNGVDGTADNILKEVSKLKQIDEAVKNRPHLAETMEYASKTQSTGVINTMLDNWARFENRDKNKVASLLLDIAELKEPEALKTFTDGLAKTSPELFSRVLVDHAYYSALSGMSTHTTAAISNSVLDPYIWSPLQKTVASGLNTVRDVISRYNINRKIKNLSKEEVSALSTKIKDRSFLENYIGRELTDNESKAFAVGKLKLKEVADSSIKLPGSVKEDFVREIANQKINNGILGYFTETPGRDTYIKEALIGLKSESESMADILIHTAKSMAKPSGYKYTVKSILNPGELLKAGVKDVVAKTARTLIDEDTIKHIDNLESIASKASQMRIDKGVQTEGVGSNTLNILKHKLEFNKGFLDSTSYLIAQATTWLRRNTIDPNAILTTLDDIGKAAAQHSTIKQLAYSRAMKEGLGGFASDTRQQEIITEALKKANGDFMYAADDFIHDIQKQAINKGEARTFTSDPSEGVLKTLLYDAPNKLDDAFSKVGIPLGSMVMLFRKTPLNMLNWAFERLPIAPLTTNFKNTLQYGSAREKDAVMANWVLGSAVVVFAYALGLDGKIIGSGLDRKSRDGAMSLHLPTSNAIKIGDRYLSLQKLQPYSTLLTAPATLSELWRAYPEHYDTDVQVEDLTKQVLAVSTLGLGNFISDMSNMRGTGELIKAISTGNTEGVLNLIANFEALMAVPNFVTQFTSQMQEHVQLADGLIEKIQVRLGMGTVDKTTFFGEPMNKPKHIVPGFLPFEYFPLYEKENNSVVRKILEGSVAAAYPLISPRNVHGKSLHRYTPRQYQKLIDILNNGEYMMSNTEYYSSLMLDKSGEYNDIFMSLLVDSHEHNREPETLAIRHSAQKMLQSANEQRVEQAKFILENIDDEVKRNVRDATEKRFEKNISINRNLQNIIGSYNVK